VVGAQSRVKRIILNADDFGLAPSINAAVIEASRNGYLTSTSLCVMGPVAEEAAAAVGELPRLSVGLHLALVDETPAAPVSEIPSLINSEGRLPRSGLEFTRRWSVGQISARDVAREVAAQWTRAERLGVRPTHFDSHDHIHVLPGVLEICLREASARGVHRLRVPAETVVDGVAGVRRRFFGLGLRVLSQRAARVATQHGFAFPDAFSGFRGAGAIDTDSLVARILAAPAGCTEIALHPAAEDLPRTDMCDWGYRWQDEYRALLDPRVGEALAASGAEIGSFRDVRRTFQAAA